MSLTLSNLFSNPNPFATLGISADSSGRKINECAKLAEMRSKLMDSSSEEEQQKIQLAAEQLRDPVQRFIWSLFWVTLTDEEEALWKDNSVLANLSTAWDSSSVQEYESIRRSDELSTWTHNKAALSLGAAIACDAQDLKQSSELWADAFKAWRLIDDSSNFWDSMDSRANALDDPRIGSAEVIQYKEELPLYLLGYCANRSTNALINRDISIAEHWVSIIRESPFASSKIDATLGKIYEPFVNRINLGLEKLEAKSAGGGAPTKTLKEIAKVFESDLLPLIRQILQLGDLPGLAEEYVRDRAARLLRQISIPLHKASETELDYQVTLWALEIVDSKTLKDKLESDFDITKKYRCLGPSLKLADKSRYDEAVALIDQKIFEARSENADEEPILLLEAKNQLRSIICGRIFNKALDALMSHIDSLKKPDPFAAFGSDFAKNFSFLQEPPEPPDKGVLDDTIRQLKLAKSFAKDREQRSAVQKELTQVKELRGTLYGSSCFVATATFGSADHNTVRDLCEFRDLVLNGTAPGRLFVRLYWMIGPYLAKAVRTFPVTKKALQPSLKVIAYLLLKTRAYHRAAKGVQTK